MHRWFRSADDGRLRLLADFLRTARGLLSLANHSLPRNISTPTTVSPGSPRRSQLPGQNRAHRGAAPLPTPPQHASCLGRRKGTPWPFGLGLRPTLPPTGGSRRRLVMGKGAKWSADAYRTSGPGQVQLGVAAPARSTCVVSRHRRPASAPERSRAAVRRRVLPKPADRQPQSPFTLRAGYFFPGMTDNLVEQGSGTKAGTVIR